MKSKKRGFTLPEVIVVLVIIALAFSISAALVPSKDKARDDARRLLCANNLRRVGAAMIMYADTYDNLMPADGAMINGTYKRDISHFYVVYRGDGDWWSSFNPKTGRYAPLRWACLFEAGFITDPNLFYCPNNEISAYKYESYINPPPWGTLPQNYNNTYGNQWVRIGYTYFPTDYTSKLRYDIAQTGQPYREPNCTRFDKLDSGIPYATDLLWSRDSLSHKSGIRKVGTKVT
ncbi:MAG: type II secretion system protein, partial [Sedimentisphaerales bacterium]